jgi:hypothetical protein
MNAFPAATPSSVEGPLPTRCGDLSSGSGWAVVGGGPVTTYCSALMKPQFPFGLTLRRGSGQDLSKPRLYALPFDKLRANGSNFVDPNL